MRLDEGIEELVVQVVSVGDDLVVELDGCGCLIRLTVASLVTSLLDMSKQTMPTFPRYRRAAETLGERLRLARLRRRFPERPVLPGWART